MRYQSQYPATQGQALFLTCETCTKGFTLGEEIIEDIDHISSTQVTHNYYHLACYNPKGMTHRTFRLRDTSAAIAFTTRLILNGISFTVKPLTSGIDVTIPLDCNTDSDCFPFPGELAE